MNLTKKKQSKPRKQFKWHGMSHCKKELGVFFYFLSFGTLSTFDQKISCFLLLDEYFLVVFIFWSFPLGLILLFSELERQTGWVFLQNDLISSSKTTRFLIFVSISCIFTLIQSQNTPECISHIINGGSPRENWLFCPKHFSEIPELPNIPWFLVYLSRKNEKSAKTQAHS